MGRRWGGRRVGWGGGWVELRIVHCMHCALWNGTLSQVSTDVIYTAANVLTVRTATLINKWVTRQRKINHRLIFVKCSWTLMTYGLFSPTWCASSVLVRFTTIFLPKAPRAVTLCSVLCFTWVFSSASCVLRFIELLALRLPRGEGKCPTGNFWWHHVKTANWYDH